MSFKQVLEKAQKIKVIVTDVDGVLTDGYVFITDNHEEPFAKFNILDGLAIKLAHQGELSIVVISGRKSLATEARCRKLGIDYAYTGIEDKRSQLLKVAAQIGVGLDEMAYVGDDLIDLPALIHCGLSIAPANAVRVVKKHVDYVSQITGGNGVLRDAVELILKAQAKLDNIINSYLVK